MVIGPGRGRSLGVLARDRWRALGEERSAADRRVDRRSLAIRHHARSHGRRRRHRPDDAGIRQAAGRSGNARRCSWIRSPRRGGRSTSRASTSRTTRSPTRSATRLREPDGPEVIVVTPQRLPRLARAEDRSGAFRDSVFRQLIAADQHKRLRLVYPPASRARDVADLRPLEGDDRRRRVRAHRIGQLLAPVDGHGHRMRPGRRRRRRRERAGGIRRIRDRLLGGTSRSAGGGRRPGDRRAGDRFGRLLDAREDAEHTLARARTSRGADPRRRRRCERPPIPTSRSRSATALESLIPPVDAHERGASPLRIWILPGVARRGGRAVAWRSSASGAHPFQTLQRRLDSMPASSAVAIGAGVFVLGEPRAHPARTAGDRCRASCSAARRGGLVALAGSLVAAAASATPRAARSGRQGWRAG